MIHHLGKDFSGDVLDVACGTGNYTRAIESSGICISGVDRSQKMLAYAHSKEAGMPWVLGDVADLPFMNSSFSAAICTLATHHFDSLKASFDEVYRVLSSGVFVIFTATPEQMRGYWLNKYFPVAMKDSIEQMPKMSDVEEALLSVGFCEIATEKYEIQPDLADHFLYSGKSHPEWYLDADFRLGISTFSSLAHADEVESGCRRLAEDLEMGVVEDVIDSYKHDLGDYMFVIAKKEST